MSENDEPRLAKELDGSCGVLIDEIMEALSAAATAIVGAGSISKTREQREMCAAAARGEIARIHRLAEGMERELEAVERLCAGDPGANTPVST
jgi:hypothetical protein